MTWPPCADEGLERVCDFSRASARKQRSWDSNHGNLILDIWFLAHSFINSKCLLLSGIAKKKKKIIIIKVITGKFEDKRSPAVHRE